MSARWKFKVSSKSVQFIEHNQFCGFSFDDEHWFSVSSTTIFGSIFSSWTVTDWLLSRVSVTDFGSSSISVLLRWLAFFLLAVECFFDLSCLLVSRRLSPTSQAKNMVYLIGTTKYIDTNGIKMRNKSRNAEPANTDKLSLSEPRF